MTQRKVPRPVERMAGCYHYLHMYTDTGRTVALVPVNGARLKARGEMKAAGRRDNFTRPPPMYQYVHVIQVDM